MIVNRTQRIVEFVSFLLLWVSAAMFTVHIDESST